MRMERVMGRIPKFPATLIVSVITLGGLAGFTQHALAKTFVYVSNADTGTIFSYQLEKSGDLVKIEQVAAGKAVMPMAVSPDRRFLYAHVRSAPTGIQSYSINPHNGRLKALDTTSIPLSAPYISVDRTGKYLFSVSYGANKLAASPIANNGVVTDQHQILETGKQPHAVLVDPTNHFVFATNLGADQIQQFIFDEKTASLKPNDSPAVAFPETSPRHFRFSPDGRYVYALSETRGTVTRLTLDATRGQLSVAETVSGVPESLGLVPGKPHDARDAAGSAAAAPDPRPVIWAADLHLTPDGRFLYMSERNSSTIAVFSIEAQTGKLFYLKSVPTEAQPRGFNIDPTGHFLICPGEKSEFLSVFRIDTTTGDLQRLHRTAIPKSSSWVETVELP